MSKIHYATTALIRDHYGTFLQGQTQELTQCSPKEAEAKAFLLGLQLATDLPCNPIILEGDN